MRMVIAMSSLEEIAKIYGMVDYYDMASGTIYKLSQAVDSGKGVYTVPVEENGKIVGYTSMKKIV